MRRFCSSNLGQTKNTKLFDAKYLLKHHVQVHERITQLWEKCSLANYSSTWYSREITHGLCNFHFSDDQADELFRGPVVLILDKVHFEIFPCVHVLYHNVRQKFSFDTADSGWVLNGNVCHVRCGRWKVTFPCT